MIKGKFNVVLDKAWGSSGKGKLASWLADKNNVINVSSSNFPNAGHSVVFENGTKFIAKAIPTAAALKQHRGMDMNCWISPGSGFNWIQLIKEWVESGKPKINIHDRASIVTEEHKKRESEGLESTKHIASTMQGSAAAIVDKVLRKKDVVLAGTNDLEKVIMHQYLTNPVVCDLLGRDKGAAEAVDKFIEQVQVIPGWDFRELTYQIISQGNTWLHEGSQGYALSIDHGSHYPECTSRNCSLQAAMDHMAIPPAMVGDVYLNLRAYEIRVGNVIEDGIQKGYSGDFYPDSKELSWEEVAKRSGMPTEEAVILAERERTTVTKRIRRVATFSFDGLVDACRTNGATKLCVNFIQYINWADNGLRGGKEAFDKLSKESRAFISKIEEVAGIPVVLVGTGAKHDEMINLV